MRLLLALVLGGMATSACAAPQAEPYTLSGLFREACIDTGMDRSSVAALASEKGWQTLPFDAGEDGPEWGDGYTLGYARVMLTGDDKTSEPDAGRSDRLVVRPAQKTCEVDFRDAPSGWQDHAAEIAGSLAFRPITMPAGAGDLQERHWAKGREALLTSRYDPSTGIVSLSVMRITDPEISLATPSSGNR